jgi:hypothetical protein
MKLLAEAGWSHAAIGEAFYRDHTTVGYAVQAVTRHALTPLFAEREAAVREALGLA